MKSNLGFTLIEILVVVFIVLVALILLVFFINPLEIIKEGRDSIRLNDLKGFEKTINLAVQDNINNLPELLCTATKPPCLGNSNDLEYDTKANNGTGWVKMDFKKGFTLNILPLDPINNPKFFYRYATNLNGSNWEINAKFESSKFLKRMQEDEGNNDKLLK